MLKEKNSDLCATPLGICTSGALACATIQVLTSRSTIYKMYRNLCVFLLFVIFGSAVSLPNVPDELASTNVDISCVSEANIKWRELLQYQSLKMGFIYDKKIACYNFCIGKKAGLVNEDGTMNIDAAANRIPGKSSKKTREIMNKCTNIKTADDPCKTMFDNTNCIMRQIFESFLSLASSASKQ